MTNFFLGAILVLLFLFLLALLIFMVIMFYSCAKYEFSDIFDDWKEWRNRKK